MVFSVWCHRSRAPWFWGWYADDLYWVIPSSCMSCWNTPDIKLEPWSDWIELGRLTNVKNLVKALTIVFALIFLRCMASGNLVDAHMMVNKYWFPDLVFGNGPTQSTITLSKGFWTAGMGCSAAFGIVWFGFSVCPISWTVAWCPRSVANRWVP